jgi:hypothetical protein
MRPLTDNPHIQVHPEVVAALGSVEKAYVLATIHYWCERNRTKQTDAKRDGHWWTYHSYANWAPRLGMSERAVRRVITALEDDGLLIAGNYNQMHLDRTKWLRVNYEALEALLNPSTDEHKPDHTADVATSTTTEAIGITPDAIEGLEGETAMTKDPMDMTILELQSLHNQLQDKLARLVEDESATNEDRQTVRRQLLAVSKRITILVAETVFPNLASVQVLAKLENLASELKGYGVDMHPADIKDVLAADKGMKA